MKRYQDMAYDLTRHIFNLTAEGVFDGHQSARTVFCFFAMNVANTDNPERGLKRGHVMEGVINQTAIMKYTGLSSGAVSKAVQWLDGNNFIYAQYRYEGGRQRRSSVEIISRNAETEAARTSLLAKPAPKVQEPAAQRGHLSLVQAL